MASYSGFSTEAATAKARENRSEFAADFTSRSQLVSKALVHFVCRYFPCICYSL